jgi:hypothetical protein
MLFAGRCGTEVTNPAALGMNDQMILDRMGFFLAAVIL